MSMGTDSFLDHVIDCVIKLHTDAIISGIKITSLSIHPDDLDRLRDEAINRGLMIQKWGIMQYEICGIPIKASTDVPRIHLTAKESWS